MHNVKESSYGLLLLTAIVLLLVLVLSPIAKIDFQDKTMFGFPVGTMVWIIPLLLIFLWLLYILTKRFLYSLTIARAHILITVFVTILIIAVVYIGINPSLLTNTRNELIGNALQLLSIVLVLGQALYLTNIILGILRRTKTH